MATISLTQGLVTSLDDADLPIVQAHRWAAHRRRNTFYAVTNVNQKTVYMHSLIMGSLMVDHVDRNGLNNHRSNLRITTTALNAANSGPRKGTYKGVSFDPRRGTWYAQIKVNYRRRYLGAFATPEEAARAYDAAALAEWGDNAYKNFP